MAQQYRPLFKLDAGGMAEVYVAEAVSMAGFKKKVAIKRILPGLLKDERFVRMFLDEARLSLHLNHANVVSVFDIGMTGEGLDKSYFIVMEYVEGTTLKNLLEYYEKTKRVLPVPMSIWIVNEILKGLEYAHDLRDPESNQNLHIVHRDISPPNILISWNGEVKLTDFGLAKATTQLESTDPGVVKGKFSYLSPEAAHGKEVDKRTDIFAVGILAFELLTGRRLFKGETDWQTVEKVRNADIPSLAALNPAVSAALETIVRRALAKDVAQRYPTCGAFADDLLGVLFSVGQRVSARDFSHLLDDMRQATQTRSAPESLSAPTNLIMELMREELISFRSIDEESEDDLLETGATPLSSLAGGELPTFEPSQPLIDQLEAEVSVPMPRGRSLTPAPLQVPPAVQPRREPSAPAPAPVSAPARTPAPANPPTSLPPPTPMPMASSRLPSPAPRRESSGKGWIVVVLLLLVVGGGAAYYLLVMNPQG